MTGDQGLLRTSQDDAQQFATPVLVRPGQSIHSTRCHLSDAAHVLTCHHGQPASPSLCPRLAGYQIPVLITTNSPAIVPCVMHIALHLRCRIAGVDARVKLYAMAGRRNTAGTSVLVGCSRNPSSVTAETLVGQDYGTLPCWRLRDRRGSC